MINKLEDFLINTDAAVYKVSGRGDFREVKKEKFLETYTKKESSQIYPDRVSEDKTKVKIWLRSYDTTTYVIETAKTNFIAETQPQVAEITPTNPVSAYFRRQCS